MAELPISEWPLLAEALAWLTEHEISESDTKKNLPRACRNSRVRSRGRCWSYFEHDDQVEICGLAWDRAVVDWENSGFTIPGSYENHKFTDVEVELKGLVDWLGEGEGDGQSHNIGAETQCRKWLENLMKEGKKKSKPDYLAEAQNKFQVGTKAFARAWAGAIEKTGNSEWSRPGRKS